jgi:hypothetical protein
MDDVMELNDKRKVVAYSPTFVVAALLLLSSLVEIVSFFDRGLKVFQIPYYVIFAYTGVAFIFLTLKRQRPDLLSFINLYLMSSIAFAIFHARALWIDAVKNNQSKGSMSQLFEEALGANFVVEQKVNVVNMASLDAFYMVLSLIACLFLAGKWASYVIKKNSDESLDFYEFLVRGIFNFSVIKFIGYSLLVVFLLLCAEDFGSYIAAPNNTKTLSQSFFG